MTTSTPSEQEIAKALGRNVRTARKAAGLSLRALAERLDVSHVTISYLENGQRHASAVFLVRVAVALHIHPSALFVIDLPQLGAAEALSSIAEGLRRS